MQARVRALPQKQSKKRGGLAGNDSQLEEDAVRKMTRRGNHIGKNTSTWHRLTQNPISFVYVWQISFSEQCEHEKSNLFNPIWAALICGPWSNYVSNPWPCDLSMTHQMGFEWYAIFCLLSCTHKQCMWLTGFINMHMGVLLLRLLVQTCRDINCVILMTVIQFSNLYLSSFYWKGVCVLG